MDKPPKLSKKLNEKKSRFRIVIPVKSIFRNLHTGFKSISIKDFEKKLPSINGIKANLRTYREKIRKLKLPSKFHIFGSLGLTFGIIFIIMTYHSVPGEIFFPFRSFYEEKFLSQNSSDININLKNGEKIISQRLSGLTKLNSNNECIEVLIVETDLKRSLSIHFNNIFASDDFNQSLKDFNEVIEKNYFEKECDLALISPAVMKNLNNLLITQTSEIDIAEYEKQIVEFTIWEYDLKQKFKTSSFTSQQQIDNLNSLFVLSEKQFEKLSNPQSSQHEYLINIISLNVTLSNISELLESEHNSSPAGWVDYVTTYCIYTGNSSVGCDSESLNSTYNSIFQTENIAKQIEQSEKWFKDLI